MRPRCPRSTVNGGRSLWPLSTAAAVRVSVSALLPQKGCGGLPITIVDCPFVLLRDRHRSSSASSRRSSSAASRVRIYRAISWCCCCTRRRRKMAQRQADDRRATSPTTMQTTTPRPGSHTEVGGGPTGLRAPCSLGEMRSGLSPSHAAPLRGNKRTSGASPTQARPQPRWPQPSQLSARPSWRASSPAPPPSPCRSPRAPPPRAPTRRRTAAGQPSAPAVAGTPPPPPSPPPAGPRGFGQGAGGLAGRPRRTPQAKGLGGPGTRYGCACARACWASHWPVAFSCVFCTSLSSSALWPTFGVSPPFSLSSLRSLDTCAGRRADGRDARRQRRCADGVCPLPPRQGLTALG